MEQNVNDTKTVKYYCPLLVQMEIDKSEERNDGSDWLEPCDGVRYLSEIQDAIDLDCYRTMKGKGLMEYFTDNENISAKVLSAFPGVEIIDGEIYGVMVTKQNENLLVDEEEQFIEYMGGQFSDGWGEGFEQRPIKTSDGEIYVSFWERGNDYFLLPEEDFRATLSQNQSGHQPGGIVP